MGTTKSIYSGFKNGLEIVGAPAVITPFVFPSSPLSDYISTIISLNHLIPSFSILLGTLKIIGAVTQNQDNTYSATVNIATGIALAGTGISALLWAGITTTALTLIALAINAVIDVIDVGNSRMAESEKYDIAVDKIYTALGWTVCVFQPVGWFFLCLPLIRFLLGCKSCPTSDGRYNDNDSYSYSSAGDSHGYQSDTYYGHSY